MNVLLLGATGTLGSRIVPALLSHSHRVVALIRNRQKFLDFMPPGIHDQVQIVEGNATDSSLIKKTLRDQGVSYIVNAAGAANIFAKDPNPFVDIVKATVQAADALVQETNRPIGAWFFGGLLLLDVPASTDGQTLEHYLPFYKEHSVLLPILSSSREMSFSLLCPGQMVSDSKVILTPDEHRERQQRQGHLLAGGLDGGISAPPGWRTTFFSELSSFGTYVDILANVWRYQVKTEDVAEFLATYLTGPKDRFRNQRVGIVYPA